MKRHLRARPLGWGSILLLSMAFCGAGRAQLPVAEQARTATRSNASNLDWSKAGEADADRLYAQLWVNTSPEYKAICLQTFQAALLHVRLQVLEAPAIGGVPVGARGKPMAVIADLDETILDNSGFQTQMVLAGKAYTPEAWEQWVEQITGVRLVPGAGRFIEEVEKLGVRMVYLSNRSASSSAATVETLRRLGVDVAGLDDPETRRLLLKTDSSNKEERRRMAAEKYDVAAFLGDNLGDFPEIVGDDNGQRNQRLETFRELLGTRWFVLPNPAYGDWTRSFRESGPREYLREDYEARKEMPR